MTMAGGVGLRPKAAANSVGTRLRAFREERNLSMRELASVSGVSVSLISKIEGGKVSPTVMSLQKLLDAMDIDLYELFLDKSAGNPSDQIVFRRADMAVSKDKERVWRYAFPKHPEIKAELTYEEYQPHTKAAERETHRGDILGYVVSGKLSLEVNGKGTFHAEAGDAFYIKARQPHIARNDGDDVLKLVATVLLT